MYHLHIYHLISCNFFFNTPRYSKVPRLLLHYKINSIFHYYYNIVVQKYHAKHSTVFLLTYNVILKMFLIFSTKQMPKNTV